MTIGYDNMAANFFGLPGRLLSGDCGHRVGFEHVKSTLIQSDPDLSALARVHELECLTCGNIWKFAQKSLPARD